MSFNFVSFFSGGMGLDIGLEQSGGINLLSNDICKGSKKTVLFNRPDAKFLDCSIESLSGTEVFLHTSFKKNEIDLVCGGPPCQAFSVYGNRSGTIDPRGNLIFEFIRMVGEISPKCFLMENVRGLHSMAFIPKKHAQNIDGYEDWMGKKGSLLKVIIREFENIGYDVSAFLVNSVNYGAPQLRERLILMGSKTGIKPYFPKPTHSNRPEDNLLAFRTLSDALQNNFVDTEKEVMNFSPRKLKYLAKVPSGGNWRSLPLEIQKESMGKSFYLKGGRSATWRRLSWKHPSPTVVTLPNHASTSMCHPDEVRALTVAECAAIQEFPIDWKFLGTTAEKYRQIGNAVPIRLGKIAGEVIDDLVNNKKNRRNYDYSHTDESKVVHLRPHVRTRRYWHKGKALDGNSSYYNAS